MSSEPKFRRPFSTLRKESSAEDDLTLYTERQNSLVPLTSSPFLEKPAPPPIEVKKREYHQDELRVYVSEIPWSDLLLEIAMTTAFASLTDGTPILQGSSVSSYLSFFAMVWWVWASQVAYNVRFRQADWFHRFFVFLQLLVFCALATFTNNFDITNGIANETNEQKLMTQLQLADFASHQDIAVANFRSSRLPTLNARGISLTMAFSRLVLLVQYTHALWHVPREDAILGNGRRTHRSAFFVHIGSLALSSVCYFVAYGVIGKNPSEADQIAKLFLWYIPIFVEVAAHFVAATVPGRVRYPAVEIYKRSSTVFIIILGGGLDKITQGFQYIVGNVSIGWESVGLILCAAMIFILLFTLYFGTSEGDKLGSRRALGLFFFHYFYLSALIITLQGISAMLRVGNIGNALETPFQFVKDSSTLMTSKGFGVYLDKSDYSDDFVHSLNKTGIALTSLLGMINSGIGAAVNLSDTSLPYNYLLQADIAVMVTILSNFNALPDSDSLLLAKIYAFYDNDASNYTEVNNGTYQDIIGEVLTTNATPALWFYAAGGSVLVSLALMCLLNRWPRGEYEWGQTISRLVLGIVVIAFSALDIHASSDVIDDNFKYKGSRIWYLAAHSWVLPPYALALITEQIIEFVLLYMAVQAYKLEGFSVFWRRVPRFWPYASTGSADPSNSAHVVGVHEDHEEHQILFNPYDAYAEKTEYIPMTSPPAAMNSSDRARFDLADTSRPSGPRRAQDGAHRPWHVSQTSTDSAVQPLISRV